MYLNKLGANSLSTTLLSSKQQMNCIIKMKTSTNKTTNKNEIRSRAAQKLFVEVQIKCQWQHHH